MTLREALAAEVYLHVKHNAGDSMHLAVAAATCALDHAVRELVRIEGKEIIHASATSAVALCEERVRVLLRQLLTKRGATL